MGVKYIPKSIENAETIEGFPPSITPQPASIPVSDENGKLKEGWFDTPYLKLDHKYKITNILIPMYIYPTDIYNNTDYNTLFDIAKTYKDVGFVVIVNPDSGPGTDVDTNYETAIKRMVAAGITPIGYVATTYANKPIDDVKAEIDTWLSLYPQIQGLFLDETPTNSNKISYYEDITNYARLKNLYPIVLNPGTVVSKAWFDSNAGDVFVIYENEGVPSEEFLRGEYTNPSGFLDSFYRKRAVLCYNVTFGSDIVLRLKKYTGMFYITDDTLPDPWDSLPSYLSQVLDTCTIGSGITTDADLLDGHDSSIEPDPDTVAVRTDDGALKANQIILTAPDGTPPISITSTTVIENLNADLHEGYHASPVPAPDTIPVADVNGKLQWGGYQKKSYLTSIEKQLYLRI